MLMNNMVCLVTGATSGIGQAAAAALAAQGFTVAAGGRDPQRMRTAVEQIQQTSGSQEVYPLLGDLADLEQVRGMAAAFRAQFGRLDVLVNNAGGYFNTYRPTAYGVEMTLLVNHLGPFLLTNLLLDLLQAAPAGRIVTVSSDSHRFGEMNFDDLGFSRGYNGGRAYGRSKLANVLFTYELARRLQGSRVTANALHPGAVATNIFSRDLPVVGPLITRWGKYLMQPPEQGADNTVYLASAPELAEVTGKYFVKRQAVRSSPLSYQEDVAYRLWQVSEALAAPLHGEG